jgi:sterol 3beta-glucosyltransferase
VSGHGLSYAYTNNDLVELLESDEGREAIENMTTPWGLFATARRLMKQLAPTMRAMLVEGWEAAQSADPDVLVCHPKALGCVHYAEKLGVPVIIASPFPQFVPTSEFPSVGFPEWKLGGWYNKLTYAFVRKVAKALGKKYIREWRASQGMPPQPSGTDILHSSAGDLIPIMHGYSAHVVPRPSDWPATAVVTGYWFLDRQDDWQPDADLEDFLAAGDPPVYVGFGSMAGRHPRRVTNIVVGALQRSNKRGIVATGWGGLEADDLPDTIHKIDSVPHDWLFPRVAAVVHHGGAGTTAAGLRAGCPTIVCPFFGDQPFWGRRVRDLGAGTAPIPQKKLTIENLSNAILEVTSNPAMRANAQAVAEKIRTEDGVARAVEFVERIGRQQG